MKQHDYGTCHHAIGRFNVNQLRFNVDIPMALRISCYSRNRRRRTDAGVREGERIREIDGIKIDKEYKYYSMESPRTWIPTLYKCGNKPVNYYDS